MTISFFSLAMTAILCLSSFHSIEAFAPLSKSSTLPTKTTQMRASNFATKRPFGFKVLLQSSSSEEAAEATDNNDDDGSIDVSTDERLYRIRLPRAPGIEWGTDLSFSFVYVRGMEPAGPASLSGQVSVNDQICEIRPVPTTADPTTAAAVPTNLIGAPFDQVMQTFANLDRSIIEVDLVFFKGTKEDLKAACAGGDGNADEKKTIAITVIQNKGNKDETTKTIVAPVGCNLRQVLVDEGINVYQSFTRWTNCKGKQLCGTCIVNVPEGGLNTNRKSMDEASTLRENPETYRLSCVTFAYDDITVETFPPIEAAQWTR